MPQRYLGINGNARDRVGLDNDIAGVERALTPLAWVPVSTGASNSPGPIRTSSGPLDVAGSRLGSDWSAIGPAYILAFVLPPNPSGTENLDFEFNIFHGLNRIPMNIVPLNMASQLIVSNEQRLAWTVSKMRFTVAINPTSTGFTPQTLRAYAIVY